MGYYFTPPKLTDSQLNAYLNHYLAGKNWKDRLQGHYRKYADDIRKIIDNGKRNGIPDDETKEMIFASTGTVGESGITYKIQRILRTESNAAVNDATRSVYKRAGIDKYYYNSQLDDRSCEPCDTLDWESHRRPFSIKTAKTGENFPPLHPNCRCYIEPVISDKFREMAEKKGKTRNQMQYEQWFWEYVLKKNPYRETTHLWKETIIANPVVEDLQEITVDGITYHVDGVTVKHIYNAHEKDIAKLLSAHSGKKFSMVPTVTGGNNSVSTPDYLADNVERWDLKQIEGYSKDPIRNAVHRKRKQAEKFAIEIMPSCGHSLSNMIVFAKKSFASYNMRFVDELVIIKDGEIVFAIERQ